MSEEKPKATRKGATREERDLRQRILTDILAHLRVHGAENWDRVRNMYPDVLVGPPGSVPDRKFWRYVAAVRKPGKTAEGLDRIGEAPDEAKAYLKDAVNRATAEVAKDLPLAPSPSYVAGEAGGYKGPSIFAMIDELYLDAVAVRRKAMVIDKATGQMTVGADGVPVALNPGLLSISMRDRMNLINTMVTVRQEVWDLQRNEDFYREIIDIIVTEIGGADPVLMRRVMDRLKVLNDARGVTVYSNPTAD